MTVIVHPSAIIAEGARIGDGARIGPFCVIGSEVSIGEGTVLDSHVTVSGRTDIGAHVRIYPFAAIGCEPQDNSYAGEPGIVRIGDHCILREHVTIHRGTARGKLKTVIGDHCFLMVGAHVAHDGVIGHHVTMVNNSAIAGHAELGDYVTLGGLAAVQQRFRIGAYAFIGGLTGVSSDVIPFGIAVGERAELGGLNIVGLKRRGFDRPAIHTLRTAYREIFFGRGTLDERVERAADRFHENQHVMTIIEFIRKGGTRALCTPRNVEI